MILYPQSYFVYFLIVTLILYWLVCRKPTHKKVLLIVASVGLLSAIQLRFTFALVCWIIIVYQVSRAIGNPATPNRLRLLTVALVGLIGYLSFFKHIPHLLQGFFSSGGSGTSNWLRQEVILPLGISYFTFKFLHYLINAYRGQLPQHSFLDFFLYSVFFPIVPAGPIERIEGFV